MNYSFALHFLIIAVSSRIALAEIPTDVRRAIDKQENIVSQVAEEVITLFERRSFYVNECECSRHSCSNDASGHECTSVLGEKPAVCGPTCEGRRIHFNISGFRTPPDTNVHQMSTRLKESICVYSHLEPLMKKLVTPEDPAWMYFGGVDGSFRIYPNALRDRGVENGDSKLGKCKQYDPRIRPWFIGASTRPKDVVFVIDLSGSMTDKAGPLSDDTRWEVTRKAVTSMLDTLASFDYVNVVTFSHESQRLERGSSLLQGTKENLEYLKNKLNKLHPSGATSFTEGFKEAFNILTKACGERIEKQTCSECHKVILFLTDGRDTSLPGGAGIKASDMLKNIEQYQESLEKTTSRRASIFTFSMGDTSDDSIPRQIACGNHGSWSFIGHNTDALTALNSYYHFLTNYNQRSSPIWVNPYEDDGGLGLITTVAKPVYSRPSRAVDGVFLGVVGRDVLLSDLQTPDVSYEEVLGELILRSQRCNTTVQSPCQLQVHRNAYADEAVCVDPISSENKPFSAQREVIGKGECFRGSGKFYKLFSANKTWRKAKDTCKSDNGQLVVIKGDVELAIVAGIASADGSWIGAHRNMANFEMEWIDNDATNENLKSGSGYWGKGEPNNYDGAEHCVHVDRRGVNGNLNDEDCEKQLSFICEYSSSGKCASEVNIPKKGYFSSPPLTECVHEEESLANAKPVERAKSLTSSNVMCPLGERKNSFDVICCSDCLKPESNDDSSTTLVLAVVLPIGCVLVLFLIVLLWYWQRKKTMNKGNTYYPKAPPSVPTYSGHPINDPTFSVKS